MASSPQHEPTMEEILASIRKIISEDSAETNAAPAPKPAAAPARARPAPPPPPPQVETDVLELTQEIEETPPPPPPPPREPVRQAAPPPPPPPPEPEDDVVFEANEPEPPRSHDGIFSDKTRKAVENVFSTLDRDPEPQRRSYVTPPTGAIDGHTVEQVFERSVREGFDPIVRQWLGNNADAIVERMKPVIREWMDEHFPALLEGAVREEVARVAKARATPSAKR